MNNMANWVVVWKFKPCEKIKDTAIHYRHISDTTKKMAIKTAPKLTRYPEYVEILEVVSAKIWDKRIEKERKAQELKGEQNT